MENLTTLIYQSMNNLVSKVITKEIKSIVSQNVRPSLRVVILMILATGIAYPLLLVVIGHFALPFQSDGSLLTLDGKIIGSKLIAQEFKSDMFFHLRASGNSTSGVDPHITPEMAFSQIPRISSTTGLPENTLKIIIQLDIERNKVSNVLVFAPPYVNVLQVNLDLVTAYPKVYYGFTTENIEVS